MQRKKATVATRPDQTSPGSPAAGGSSRSQSAELDTAGPVGTADDVGANDWLLEEMYEQYREDPNSVAPSWKEYFSSRTNGHHPEKTSSPATAPAKPSASATPATPAKTQPAPAASSQSNGTAEAPAAQAPRARAARVEPPNQVKEARPNKPGSRGGVPADPPNPSNRPDVANSRSRPGPRCAALPPGPRRTWTSR